MPSQLDTMPDLPGQSTCFHESWKPKRKPMVNTPLIRPYFLGGWHWRGLIRFPCFFCVFFVFSKNCMVAFPTKQSMPPKKWCFFLGIWYACFFFKGCHYQHMHTTCSRPLCLKVRSGFSIAESCGLKWLEFPRSTKITECRVYLLTGLHLEVHLGKYTGFVLLWILHLLLQWSIWSMLRYT